MDLREYVETSIYLLATINPASKIFLLSSMEQPFSKEKLWEVSLRSSLVAFAILAILGVAGESILMGLFRIDIYSLKVAGGLVLLLVGMQAVTKGRFHEKSEFEQISDISIVPLAAPFIAGPGSITVSITIAANYGYAATVLCIALAIIANMAFMLTSPFLGKALERIHAIGPAVRITGLVVMAMAVQMMLSGLGDWLRPILTR